MAQEEVDAAALLAIWQDLQGTTWRLHRTLRNVADNEPSGTCTGIATFTPREASTLENDEGTSPTTSKEMLYFEHGQFENTSANLAPNKFPFSRKYIWRLRTDEASIPEISIWFVKPGSETIDYLFHTFTLRRAVVSDKHVNTVEGYSTEIECSGGHMCVEDYYNSLYVFHVVHSEQGKTHANIDSWTMHHQVQGPKKNQDFKTLFTPNCPS